MRVTRDCDPSPARSGEVDASFLNSSFLIEARRMAVDPDPLISIPAAAKAIGIERTTLGKQVRAGAVRSHGGKVRLSEVLADRAANIDLGRSKRRQGAIDEPERVEAPAAALAARDEPGPDDDADDGAPVIVDGVAMAYADARALKETYLARLKRLEFDTKRGELGRVADMQARNDEVAAIIRERLLAIPGECSDMLSREQVEFVRDKIYDAMEDLSALGTQAEDHLPATRGTDDGDASIDEAAASPQPRRVGRAVPVRGAKDKRRPG